MIHTGISKSNVGILLLMCANIAYMHLFKIPWIPVMRLYDLYLPTVHLAFDVSLFWLFSLIISFGNGKLQQFIGFLITLIWAFSNVVYSRFFGQYLSLSAVVEFFNNSTGGWWIDYLFVAFRWSDLFLVATFVIFAQIIKREEKTRSDIGFSFCFPLCVVALYFGLINPLFSALKSNGDTIVFVGDQDFNSPSFMKFWQANPDQQILQYGIFRTQVYFALFPIKNILLTEEEVQSINEIVNNTPHLACGSTNNCKKNIFFILIESYLSSTSDLIISGKEVTPTLNKLKHEKGTYFNGNIAKNISVGESSDGQLIYWTGLFPLKTEISIPYIVNNSIPCFPRLLSEQKDYKVSMILPTLSNFWRQDELNKVYGIDTIISAIDKNSPISNYFGSDMIVIDSLLNMPNDVRRFNVALTISMHAPYESIKSEVDANDGFEFPSSYSSQFCNYLMTCHYMDYHIGRFIDDIKATKQYDNSVIIIASDHPAHSDEIKMDSSLVNDYMMPFYIINANIELEKAYYGKANQVDIFTTLLDLFEIDSRWKGLGSSLLNQDTYQNKNRDDVRYISDLLIRSNWFSSYQY